MFNLSFWHMAVLGVVAVLLFGDRLPEVAKSVGRTLGEFRKHLDGLKSEINGAIYDNDPPARRTTSYHPIDDSDEPTSIKFEPPAAEPQPVANSSAHADAKQA